MIEAGAAGVHFEDQLASAKKCGHMGGKVLVPTHEFIAQADRRAPGGRRAAACRRAHRAHRRRRARACSPATSTSATAASSLGERTRRGLLTASRRHRRGHRPRPRLRAVRRHDLVRDRRIPDLDEAKTFAEAHPREVPGQAAGLQLLAVLQLEAQARRRARSPSSSASSARWATSSSSSRWPGFHALNHSMFELASGYRDAA